ncbi:MAG: hypothetical protein ACPG44_06015 [Polaribacter sp.]
MTTITIKNGDLKKKKFNDPKDLFDFLVNSFADETILVKTSLKDLNDEERNSWEQHKKDGYSDFVDFKG